MHERHVWACTVLFSHLPCAQLGGADGGATKPYAGGGAPFLLIWVYVFRWNEQEVEKKQSKKIEKKMVMIFIAIA